MTIESITSYLHYDFFSLFQSIEISTLLIIVLIILILYGFTVFLYSRICSLIKKMTDTKKAKKIYDQPLKIYSKIYS